VGVWYSFSMAGTGTDLSFPDSVMVDFGVATAIEDLYLEGKEAVVKNL
jgi:hypothetical protein